MAAARKTAGRKAKAPAPKKCPDCDGQGEVTETVRVGSRKKRETADHQTVMCLGCWGSGTAD